MRGRPDRPPGRVRTASRPSSTGPAPVRRTACSAKPVSGAGRATPLPGRRCQRPPFAGSVVGGAPAPPPFRAVWGRWARSLRGRQHGLVPTHPSSVAAEDLRPLTPPAGETVSPGTTIVPAVPSLALDVACCHLAGRDAVHGGGHLAALEADPLCQLGQRFARE